MALDQKRPGRRNLTGGDQLTSQAHVLNATLGRPELGISRARAPQPTATTVDGGTSADGRSAATTAGGAPPEDPQNHHSRNGGANTCTKRCAFHCASPAVKPVYDW